MKKCTTFFLFILLLTESNYLFAQKGKKDILCNRLGLSVPIIWNNSEATYYLLGSPKYPTGNSISYGLNINYSRRIFKVIYGQIGVGYFKQYFNIKRPFNYYPNPGQILYATTSYNYNNIQLSAGLGYKQKVCKNVTLNGFVSYNYYNSLRQKYVNPKVYQVNKKSLSLGEMISFDLGIEMKISKRMSLGVNAILPTYTHWNKDGMFINNHYSNDEQQIARNKSSTGLSAACYYCF